MRVAKRPMRWAQLFNESRQRRWTVPPDFRSEFERDYDRAVFSTPLRRLQDKTQVFPLEEHDAIRTRLTHTLEVSTVARSLARDVARWLIEEGKLSRKKEEAHKLETIAATCGLVHDIGNPPFGHAGEKAIQDWFAKTIGHGSDLQAALRGEYSQLSQDFLKFDGNAQTIRLLTQLQVFGHKIGLNLTFGTLSAALKYTTASHETVNKPGYFASEQSIVDQVWKNIRSKKLRNPITYLVEAADDIVYLSVDIEDAIKKGELTWQRLRGYLPRGDGFASKVRKETEKLAKGINVRSDAYQETYGQAFRIAAIRAMAPAAVDAFKKGYRSIMVGEYEGELLGESKAKDFVKACTRVARAEVYTAHQVLRLETMGRNVIHDLLDFFWEGARYAPYPSNKRDFPSKIYRLISPNYRKVFEAAFHERHFPPEYLRLQLIADYVAGMTDTFACTLHGRLRNG